MITRTSHTEIVLLLRWNVAGGTLTPAALLKLAPYITRYADTFNVRVHAVGGTADHIHVLCDIPGDMTADKVTHELQPATARYLRDVLGAKGFAWGTASVVSVSPSEVNAATAYLSEHESRHERGECIEAWEGGGESGAATAERAGDSLPSWLTDAMGGR